MELVPFAAFGLAFAALVGWLVAKSRAGAKVRLDLLARMGFAPCPSEAGSLAEQVAQHENNSEYRYRVTDPMRASVGDEPVWFYTKERMRQGSIVAAHELRFPLERPSSEGLVLFMKPSALRAGTTATLIGSLATAGWDAHPDDLTRVEVPVDLEGSNLIGVLGPAGASLYDLIDAKHVAALGQVGDFGVLVVTCRGRWCSLASSTTRMDLDLERLWPLVQQLVASGR